MASKISCRKLTGILEEMRINKKAISSLMFLITSMPFMVEGAFLSIAFNAMIFKMLLLIGNIPSSHVINYFTLTMY